MWLSNILDEGYGIPARIPKLDDTYHVIVLLYNINNLVMLVHYKTAISERIIR